MPARHSLVEEMPADLREGVEKLRTALAVPASFPDDVVAEAERAASGVALPERDLTDVPFVTIDPEGARDLDQAVHLERSGEGYLVRYAIADVAAFVAPGGAIDAEAHRRGVTLYAPTMRTPLHPPVLSEGAASLLPGEVRPALVWELTLDASGEGFLTMSDFSSWGVPGSLELKPEITAPGGNIYSVSGKSCA